MEGAAVRSGNQGGQPHVRKPGGPPPPPRSKKNGRPNAKVHEGGDQAVDYVASGSGYNASRQARSVSPTGHALDGFDPGASLSSHRSYDRNDPETTIGVHVVVKGELRFERLLRIEGSFEGTLVSEGDIVVAPTGVVRGPIKHMRYARIEGTVAGDIDVQECEVLGDATVTGDITCQSLRLDPTAMLVGNVSVKRGEDEATTAPAQAAEAKSESKTEDDPAEATAPNDAKEGESASEPSAEATPAAEGEATGQEDGSGNDVDGTAAAEPTS